MKVTNNGINVIKLYNDNKLTAANEKGKSKGMYDTVEISKEGQELARYVAITNSIEGNIANKVDEIKNKIQSGKYDVSSEQIAHKMFQTIKGENI